MSEDTGLDHDSACDCDDCCPALCDECATGWAEFCEGGSCPGGLLEDDDG